MTLLELKTIQGGAQVAKKLLQEIKPILDALNIDYDSEGGVKSTVNQTALDAQLSLSGLTKGQLDDGMYALTNSIKTVMDSAYAQLEKLASRAQ